MKYIKVGWKHDFENEPVWWYHEIGPEGYETRKVLINKNGMVETASETGQLGSIGLSDQSFISVEEINEDREFSATEISYQELEQLWNELHINQA